MEDKYNLTPAAQTLVLLFSLDLFNVLFRMPSTATIWNLPSRFPCWWQKQFLAENWVSKRKLKNNSSQHSKLWNIFDCFCHKKIYQNSLKKSFFLIFFYIFIYYAWNVFFLNKYSYEKRLFFHTDEKWTQNEHNCTPRLIFIMRFLRHLY